jgi:hypothetical protein
VNIRLAAVLAAAGLAACLMACGPSPVAHDLSVDNQNHASGGATQGYAARNRPYAFFTGMPLCTNGRPLRLTAVKLHRPQGGIKLVDWAVWPTFGYEDGTPGRAALSRYALTPKNVIDQPCGTSRKGVAVSLMLQRSWGGTLGFDVMSTSGTTYVPFALALCTYPICEEPAGHLAPD